MTEEKVKSRRLGILGWIAVVLLSAAVVAVIVGEIMMRRASPTLKNLIVETLHTRFKGRVEMDDFQVSLLKGFQVSGQGLRIFAPDEVVAAGATQPVIAVRNFAFHAPYKGLWIKPMHVGTVHVSGLSIHIPPKEMRAQAPASEKKRLGSLKIVVDEIVCDDSDLVIGTSKPGKDPKVFVLQRIAMHNIGPDDPWNYDATLVNAVPRGDIHAVGTFGPWDADSPGDSTVTGHYTFDRADLGTIKGIGGILSSVGDFTGQLNRIAVQGTTETPDFSLDTANYGMPLHTTFDAVVDGTSGDTYLNSIDAKLGQTSFTAKGTVINIKGKGHEVDLDVDVPKGRIQDFLSLAVKTQPALMTGTLGMKAAIYIRPGPQRVAEKLHLKGKFTVQQIHFANPLVQDKVDMLSLRAQGDPKLAKPGAPDVRSQLSGLFTMDAGRLNFAPIRYTLPGGNIQLAGVYSLDGAQFDFHGTVRTDAKISQMVASRWKSWLLKPVDPFFRKNGSTEIPVKVSGTKSEPKFGLELRRKEKDKDK
ncbi:MAG TPA: hypothetical protein VGC07_03595 [Granulicella sp.]